MNNHPLAITPSDTGRVTFDGLDVRVLTRDGEPWFVLADVCIVLELAEPHRAAARLDDDEKDRHSMTTLGGPQEMTVINESGLYSLILTSRKDAAKRFKKWVTAEVLPSIRKTGSYAAPDLNDPVVMRGYLLTYAEKVLTLQNKVASDAPKVAALDRDHTR